MLRSVDSVWCHGCSIYALLPETDRAGAEGLLARVRRESPEQLPAEGVQIAAFPENGCTGGALLAALAPSRETSRPSLVGAYRRVRDFGEQSPLPEAVNA